MHIQLEFLREMKYSWEECAAVLMVSRTTLWRRAQELGISRAAFSTSWNNHPLRTENGLSPLQLWTRGLCLADSSVVEQPPGDFGIEQTMLRFFV